MNKIILLMIFSLCFVSGNVSASKISNLEKQCHQHSSKHNVHFKKNVRIQSYNISTIMQSNLHGFGVVFNNARYRVIIKTGEGSRYTEQFSDIARMAKVLNLPVNVCFDDKKYDGDDSDQKDESDGRLLGIEIS